MQAMKRMENESYLAFAKRATEALQDGLIDYDEWGEAVLGENIYSQENTRRCAKFFSQFIQNLENDEIEAIDDKDKVAEILKAKENLKTERIKIQTANLEYNANARAEARGEMFNDRLIESVKSLKPIEIKRITHKPYHQGKTGLLCISDLHAGSTYEIKGLYNEIVNSYSFEIMKDRLWKLIGLVEADYAEYDNIVVGICGDLFENILRASSLTKLKEPVIDTVIKTSEFLCQWIGELQRRLETNVRVVTVGGNHDTCLFLGAKPRFEEENLTKIVTKFMQIRFEDNPYVNIDSYTDVAVIDIQDVNVMIEHGEDSNLQTTLEYFSNLYNIDIDEIISGHFHRPESKAIGITELGDRTIYRVGSICGCDTYSKRLRKAARPSAYFALYEKELGHTWSKNYYL
jgi:uncharacterized protein YerC